MLGGDQEVLLLEDLQVLKLGDDRVALTEDDDLQVPPKQEGDHKVLVQKDALQVLPMLPREHHIQREATQVIIPVKTMK